MKDHEAAVFYAPGSNKSFGAQDKARIIFSHVLAGSFATKRPMIVELPKCATLS